jgi:hypothetical protein
MSDYMVMVVRLIEMEGSHGHVMSRQTDAFSESEARKTRNGLCFSDYACDFSDYRCRSNKFMILMPKQCDGSSRRNIQEYDRSKQRQT